MRVRLVVMRAEEHERVHGEGECLSAFVDCRLLVESPIWVMVVMRCELSSLCTAQACVHMPALFAMACQVASSIA